MIGRFNRFHGYGALRGTYQRGHTARGPLLSLKYAYRDPKRPYRLAVVVSRKVSKSAVVRNRIRRRVYEIVRQQDHRLPAGSDLVFTAFSPELATIPDTQLRTTVNGLLRKARQQHSDHGQPPP
jgi:ribonuclease P protein component